MCVQMNDKDYLPKNGLLKREIEAVCFWSLLKTVFQCIHPVPPLTSTLRTLPIRFMESVQPTHSGVSQHMHASDLGVCPPLSYFQ